MLNWVRWVWDVMKSAERLEAVAFRDSVLHGSRALLGRILKSSDTCIARMPADVARSEVPTRLLSEGSG